VPTKQKIATVADLTDKFQRMQLTVIADYRGLTVAEITDLRRKLRESGAGAEVIVAKNTLTLLAAQQSGFDTIEPLLAGPTAVAFVYDDISKFVKTVNDFNKGPKKLVIRGGMLGTSLLKEDILEKVASLPQRKELLAGVLGGVTAPVAGLVALVGQPVNDIAGLVNAVVNNVVYALQARIDQLQPAGETTA
jgi:large subunit ribosomal protein L10